MARRIRAHVRPKRTKAGKNETPKRAETSTETPAALKIADWLEEAFSALSDAARAVAMRDVHEYRGDCQRADLEAICFHEQCERLRNAVIGIDNAKEV